MTKREATLEPVYTVLMDGIFKGIEATEKAGCYGSMAILIYSGMDTMAFTSLKPGEKHEGKAFIAWADRYMRFSPGKQQLTGHDLYGARCGMLHATTTASDMFAKGKCRQVGYVAGPIGANAVMYKPNSDNLVLVNIVGLKNAFIEACVAYMDEAFKQPGRLEEILLRLDQCVRAIPWAPPSD